MIVVNECPDCQVKISLNQVENKNLSLCRCAFASRQSVVILKGLVISSTNDSLADV